MKATIDAAGRLVIPKRIRREAGLESGAELEIRFEDGRIEIEPGEYRPVLKRVSFVRERFSDYRVVAHRKKRQQAGRPSVKQGR